MFRGGICVCEGKLEILPLIPFHKSLLCLDYCGFPEGDGHSESSHVLRRLQIITLPWLEWFQWMEEVSCELIEDLIRYSLRHMEHLSACQLCLLPPSWQDLLGATMLERKALQPEEVFHPRQCRPFSTHK